MDFDVLLIEEVKKHETIYNLESQSYKNVGVKEQIWEEIADHLNSNGTTCRKRWKNLRDTYRKNKNRERLWPAGNEARIAWKYYRRMAFLDNVKSSRRREDADGENMTRASDYLSSLHPLNDPSMTPYFRMPMERDRKPDVHAQFTHFLNVDGAVNNGEGCPDGQMLKDSTTLLFEALDQKIKASNLTSDQLSEMESSICSFVFAKLVKMQKPPSKQRGSKNSLPTYSVL